MYVAKVSEDCQDYHGCGKVWCVVHNGEVVAMRYMADFKPCWRLLPSWVQAIRHWCSGLDNRMLPFARSTQELSKIRKDVSTRISAPRKPRGGNCKPSTLVYMARELMHTLQSEQFSQYRAHCVQDLQKVGRVISGMASCNEVILEKVH